MDTIYTILLIYLILCLMRIFNYFIIKRKLFLKVVKEIDKGTYNEWYVEKDLFSKIFNPLYFNIWTFKDWIIHYKLKNKGNQHD